MATPEQDLLTLVLAVWGAVVSTFLAILKIVEHRKDRAVLKVSLRPNMEATPGSPYGDRLLLMVKVVNTGQRPASVTHVWLMHGQSNLLCADP